MNGKKNKKMNNVVCAKWGDYYGPEYVNILYSMVERNTTEPFRFICLTDNPAGVRDEVECMPISNTKNLEGWWAKIGFFQSPLGDIEGPVLSIDLDMVIVDNIDCFFDYEPNEFCMKWDYAGHGHSSCVMRFTAGGHGHIYDNLHMNKEEFATHNTEVGFKQKKYWGDQAWITEQMEGKTKIFPETWISKYVKECHRDPVTKQSIEERKARNAHLIDLNKEEFFIPDDCKIIAFSGIKYRNENELHKLGKWWKE